MADKTDTGFLASVRREVKRMCSRRIYVIAMVLVPIGCALFFLSLLGEGLPLKVPTAIVDLDNSQLSRGVTRSLGATELIQVTDRLTSYDEAMKQVRSGQIFGFFEIPRNFQEDALSGRTPTLNYYSNMTYFVPGTLSFKGFKTIAVATSGSIVKTTLVSTGAVTGNQAGQLLQPLVVDTHPIGNPWTNYSYYLSPSFIFALISLMVMLMTAFSITLEIKNDTSRQWLATAHNRITVALAGKLLPQTVIFCIVGFAIEALFFGFNHFPLNGSMWLMALAMVLMVIGSQALALFITCLLPNPRLSLSIVSLVGILTFSFAGFSFPVQSMYGSVAIFSYIVPARNMFLIYGNVALNGWPLYYSRYYFVALLIFPLIGCLLVRRLKRACLNPVYVP